MNLRWGYRWVCPMEDGMRKNGLKNINMVVLLLEGTEIRKKVIFFASSVSLSA